MRAAPGIPVDLLDRRVAVVFYGDDASLPYEPVAEVGQRPQQKAAGALWPRYGAMSLPEESAPAGGVR